MPDDRSDLAEGKVPTNLRLALVFEEIARAGVPLRPSQIGDALGLPKPTIHRLLATGEKEGFVQRDIDGRRFGPGPRLRKIATQVLSSERVRAERIMILKDLAEEIGETCNISVSGRDGLVYLERVETHWPLRIQLPVGTQVPFHCTAAGKMFLSSLTPGRLGRLLSVYPMTANTEKTITDPKVLQKEINQTRRRGYSLDNEEFMIGMVAIAVGVWVETERLLCTLSIHAPLVRLGTHQLEDHLPLIQDTARKLQNMVVER